jgi:hypothetical protein
MTASEIVLYRLGTLSPSLNVGDEKSRPQMVPPSFQEIGLMDLLAFDINAISADKYSQRDDAMKCPICELFGRELRFESRRLLDLHSSRFHGLSVTQLQDRRPTCSHGTDSSIGLR